MRMRRQRGKAEAPERGRERRAAPRQDSAAPVEEMEGLHPVINELAADCSSSSASRE